MQPIIKWQYEKLEGTLGLLEDHLADPPVPATPLERTALASI
jgi:hypothetical protein